MKKITLVTTLLLLAAFTLAAQEHQMSPEEQAGMERMMKAATPGEAHQLLDPMIGTWEAEVTLWMQPGQPPTVSKGVSENRWILGGRWIEQRFKGEFGGMDFEGLGHSGYDNVKGKYVSTWMDTFSTSMMTSEGEVGENGVVVYRGKHWDTMQDREIEMEDRMTVVNPDHIRSEMYTSSPDGKLAKTMEINLRRKK